jgi:hypothetical protein
MPGIKEVFAAAAQLVRMRLAERVEVAIDGGDKVKVEIGRAVRSPKRGRVLTRLGPGAATEAAVLGSWGDRAVMSATSNGSKALGLRRFHFIS